MPLDPSIYAQLDTQAPLRLSQLINQQMDPMPRYQQAMALRQAMQAEQVQAMQMQAMQQRAAQEAQSRAARAAGVQRLSAENPELAQILAADPETGLRMYAEMVKQRNADPEYLTVGDSVLEKPRMAGGALREAFKAAPKATDLARMVAERDALPAGDPRREVYDAELFKQMRQQQESARHNQAMERNAAAQLAIAQGNLGVARGRLAFDQSQPKMHYDAERGVLVNERTGETKPATMGGAPVMPRQPSRQQDANDALALIEQAEQILPQSTGSYAGTARDLAGAAVGISTLGAQASAKLKAISGTLVSKMPKMSGPQSDKDVQLYREMAGQVGDPTIPIDTRRAALQTVREIQMRYAGVQPAIVQPATGVPATVAAPSRTSSGRIGGGPTTSAAQGWKLIGVTP